MLFGQAIVNGECRLVEIISQGKKTSYVRLCWKHVPFGKVFKRHNKKHAVITHGEKIIYNMNNLRLNM